MPHYALSFELKSNDTRPSRYKSLMEQVRRAPSKSVWEETTSFVLVETTESLSTFADRLYYQTEVSSVTDILLAFDPWTGESLVRGPVKYPATLAGHFRKHQAK
jgi:hypothetical protein